MESLIGIVHVKFTLTRVIQLMKRSTRLLHQDGQYTSIIIADTTLYRVHTRGINPIQNGGKVIYTSRLALKGCNFLQHCRGNL